MYEQSLLPLNIPHEVAVSLPASHFDDENSYVSSKPKNAKSYRREEYEAAEYYLISKEDRILYHYNRNCQQIMLPFPDRRKITSKERPFIQQAKYPGFERNSEGKLAQVSFRCITRTNLQKLFDICHEVCEKRYHIRNNITTFESFTDAVIVKLMFF